MCTHCGMAIRRLKRDQYGGFSEEKQGEKKEMDRQAAQKGDSIFKNFLLIFTLYLIISYFASIDHDRAYGSKNYHLLKFTTLEAKWPILLNNILDFWEILSLLLYKLTSFSCREVLFLRVDSSFR